MILSRCPYCDTVFRVTPEQLKLRQGMVRCGRCGDAFNALDNLAPPPGRTATSAAAAVQPDAAALTPAPAAEAKPQAAPVPLPAPQPTAPFPAVDIDFPPLLDGSMAETAAKPPAEEASPAAAVAPPASESVVESSAPAAQPHPAPAPESETKPEAPAKPIADEAPGEVEEAAFPEDEEAPAPSRRSARLLTAAVVLLAVAALLQLAIVLRQPMVRAFPDSRPMLEGLCVAVGCTLELPRHADLVTIETSDLQPQGSSKERLILGATIRNRADFAQQLPHLELTLTDARDRALARRVFAPADYLPAGTDSRGGIAAGAELAVHLLLDASGVGASGYRLYVFYP